MSLVREVVVIITPEIVYHLFSLLFSMILTHLLESERKGNIVQLAFKFTLQNACANTKNNYGSNYTCRLSQRVQIKNLINCCSRWLQNNF